MDDFWDANNPFLRKYMVREPGADRIRIPYEKILAVTGEQADRLEQAQVELMWLGCDFHDRYSIVLPETLERAKAYLGEAIGHLEEATGVMHLPEYFEDSMVKAVGALDFAVDHIRRLRSDMEAGAYGEWAKPKAAELQAMEETLAGSPTYRRVYDPDSVKGMIDYARLSLVAPSVGMVLQ